MLEKLHNDLISAMKEKDRLKLATLRDIKGSMDLEHINKQVDITEELLIDVVNKQIKLRNESLESFVLAKRDDLITKVTRELEILKEYLPVQLTELEIDDLINQVFVKVNPQKPSDMGLLMKEITPLVKGKVDMKKLTNKIKERLEVLQ